MSLFSKKKTVPATKPPVEKEDGYWRFVVGGPNSDVSVKQSKDNKFLLIREFEKTGACFWKETARLEKLED